MTCIIGLEHEGRVYMGADSAAATDYTVQLVTHAKVFRHGPFLMGYTSSFRMGQLLQHKLEGVEVQVEDDDMTYLVRAFIEPVRACLKEGGFARVESNEETGGTFLIAYNGRCYVVHSNFAVLHDDYGYVCIGHGQNYAYGAMAALEGLPPKKRIRKALKIAARFDPYVAGPFVVERL